MGSLALAAVGLTLLHGGIKEREPTLVYGISLALSGHVCVWFWKQCPLAS